MNPSTQPTSAHNHTWNDTLLNIVLAMVETIITLLLRFDAPLRQAAYPLTQNNTVVCVRSYVPHVTFYATFTVNGVLLDSQLQPSQQVDVTINGFTWQIAQAIFTDQPKAIDALQMRGEVDDVAQVTHFLNTIGVVQVVQQLIASVSKKGKKSAQTDAAAQNQAVSKQQAIAEYKARISEQESQINALTIEQAQHNAQIAELNSKNKTLKIALMVVAVLWIITLIVWWWMAR
ncbi:hypothetical protein ACF3N0_06015 [Moraxella atlantae]|uniref:hypothetical protein n=1 Tax=Faucicola atlantae TaxID=34059 RepID=UPI00375159AE